MASTWLSTFYSRASRVKVVTQNTYLENKATSNKLERTLSATDLVLLGIGASIGSGIFVVTGVAAKEAGPAVTLSFALAGIASVIDALGYAELASRFPGVVGGAYLYAYASFGELLAFILFCHLMLDYHIGAASIARSLSSHLSSLAIQLVPELETLMPAFLLPGGMPALGGLISLNLIAPAILAALTILLCGGVRESSIVNGVMTVVKIVIILLVIAVGSSKVDPENWLPFAPNGIASVMTSASVVFFSYVGFDAVANTAEESKNPQRDLPVGILASLVTCALLYIGVSAVITGLVPYSQLDSSAPLAAAFAARGLHFMGGIIDLGAVVGLTTTLLAGLYVQSRLYLALARDGLLPPWVSSVNATRHTPVKAQVLVGTIAAVLGGLFDVAELSHILSVGVLVSYSLVCIAVVLLRIDRGSTAAQESGDTASQERAAFSAGMTGSRWGEALCLMLVSALFSFLLGLTTRLHWPWWASVVFFVLSALPAIPLCTRQMYTKAPLFSMPLSPVLPLIGVAFNVYLVAQMHVEAWVRIVVVTLAALLVYAFYGQHNAGQGSVAAPGTIYEALADGDET